MKKKVREAVFNKYGGRCAYCGCELQSNWQVDHAISRVYWQYHNPENTKAVNDLENLMPSCKECNHYKRSLCLDGSLTHTGFRAYMVEFHKRLAKLPKKTMVSKTVKRIAYMNTIAEKYGITFDKPFSGKFYFETLNIK